MKRILPLLFGLVSFATLSNAAAISYQISVDTSSIASSAGYIEFQFNQANASTSPAATASVSGFTSSGFTFDNMLNFSMGGVTGSLISPPLDFDNTVGGTNLYDQGVSSFGSGFSFILTLDGDALGTTATDGSQFFVFLLGNDFSPLVASGPDGVAGVTINGDTTLTPNAMNGMATVELYTPSAVPEPSAFLLLGTGVVMLISGRWLRLRRRA